MSTNTVILYNNDDLEKLVNDSLLNRMGITGYDYISNIDKIIIQSNSNITDLSDETSYGKIQDFNSLNTVYLPNTLTNIGENLFKECFNLVTIVIDFYKHEWEQIQGYNYIYDLSGSDFNSFFPRDVNIFFSKWYLSHQSEVDHFLNLTVEERSYITDITLNENSDIVTIPNGFFDNTKVTTFTVPSTVTTIEQDAFKNGMDITTINMSETQWKNVIGYEKVEQYSVNIVYSYFLFNKDIELKGTLNLKSSEITDLTVSPFNVTHFDYISEFEVYKLQTNNNTTIDLLTYNPINIFDFSYNEINYDPNGKYFIYRNQETLNEIREKFPIVDTIYLFSNANITNLDNQTVIDDNLDSIYNVGLFQHASFLKTVYLPNTVSIVGNNLFHGSDNIEKVIFDIYQEDSFNIFGFSSITKPIIFSKVKFYNQADVNNFVTDFQTYPYEHRPFRKEFTFASDSDISFIPADFFQDTNVDEFIIPSTITHIHADAFKNGLNLVLVEMSNSEWNNVDGSMNVYQHVDHVVFSYVEFNKESDIFGSMSIDTNTYNFSPSLFFQSQEELNLFHYDILIPSYRNQIESITLSEDSDITYIPNGCFRDTLITNIHIPSTLTKIDEQAFSFAQNLQYITFDFFSTDSVVQNVVPFQVRDYYTKHRFTTQNNLLEFRQKYVYDHSFNHIVYHVEFNDSDPIFNITEIPEYVFSNTLITTITLPDGIVKIGKYAFYRSLLEGTLNLPKEVLVFEESCFMDCSNISVVHMNAQPDEIHKQAFYLTNDNQADKFECFIHNNVDFVSNKFTVFVDEINNDLSSNADIAFGKNYNLIFKKHAFLSQQLLSDYIQYYVYDNSYNYYVEEIYIDHNSDINYIPENAFSYTNIKNEIDIHHVVEIRENAFYKSSVPKILVYIDDTVPSIRNGAFAENQHVNNEMTFFIQVNSFDDWENAFENRAVYDTAFFNTKVNLEIDIQFGSWIEYKEQIPIYQFLNGNEYYKDLNKIVFDKILFSARTSENTFEILDIPFEKFAFLNINLFQIPYSVVYIFEKAFYQSSINNIEFVNNDTQKYNNSKLVIIGRECFSHVTGLSNFQIPTDVNEIKDHVFSNSSLQTITFDSNNVKRIGSFTFENTNITSIIMPNSISILEEGLFKNCTSLANVTIDQNLSSITTIEEYVFYNCTSLTNMELPIKLENILDYAFYNTTNSITFNENIKTLGRFAFHPYTENLSNYTFNMNEYELLEVIIPKEGLLFDDVFSQPYNNINFTFTGIYFKTQQEIDTFYENLDVENNNPDIFNISFKTLSDITILPKNIFQNTNIETITLPETITDLSSVTFLKAVNLQNILIENDEKLIDYEQKITHRNNSIQEFDFSTTNTFIFYDSNTIVYFDSNNSNHVYYMNLIDKIPYLIYENTNGDNYFPLFLRFNRDHSRLVFGYRFIQDIDFSTDIFIYNTKTGIEKENISLIKNYIEKSLVVDKIAISNTFENVEDNFVFYYIGNYAFKKYNFMSQLDNSYNYNIFYENITFIRELDEEGNELLIEFLPNNNNFVVQHIDIGNNNFIVYDFLFLLTNYNEDTDKIDYIVQPGIEVLLFQESSVNIIKKIEDLNFNLELQPIVDTSLILDDNLELLPLSDIIQNENININTLLSISDNAQHILYTITSDLSNNYNLHYFEVILPRVGDNSVHNKIITNSAKVTNVMFYPDHLNSHFVFFVFSLEHTISLCCIERLYHENNQINKTVEIIENITTFTTNPDTNNEYPDINTLYIDRNNDVLLYGNSTLYMYTYHIEKIPILYSVIKHFDMLKEYFDYKRLIINTNTSVQTIYFHDGIRELYSDIFDNIVVNTIYIPNSLQYIGENVFSNPNIQFVIIDLFENEFELLWMKTNSFMFIDMYNIKFIFKRKKIDILNLTNYLDEYIHLIEVIDIGYTRENELLEIFNNNVFTKFTGLKTIFINSYAFNLDALPSHNYEIFFKKKQIDDMNDIKDINSNVLNKYLTEIYFHSFFVFEQNYVNVFSEKNIELVRINFENYSDDFNNAANVLTSQLYSLSLILRHIPNIHIENYVVDGPRLQIFQTYETTVNIDITDTVINQPFFYGVFTRISDFFIIDYVQKTIYLNYTFAVDDYVLEDENIYDGTHYILLRPGWTIDGKNNIIDLTGIVGWNGLVKSFEDPNEQYAMVKNVRIENGELNSNGGGIIISNSSYIHISYSESSVISADDGFTGGIVGSNCNFVIAHHCSSSGNIKRYSGGIFGYNCKHVESRKCYSTGEISGLHAGGIFGPYCMDVKCMFNYSVGHISGEGAGGIYAGDYIIEESNIDVDSDNPENIYCKGVIDKDVDLFATRYTNTFDDCFSIGNIVGNYAGGICGRYSGFSTIMQINKCYSSGNIEGERSGGIIGSNSGFKTSIYIRNSYSTGNMIVSSFGAGGIMGSNSGGVFEEDEFTYDLSTWNVNIYSSYSSGEIFSLESGGITGKDTINTFISKCFSNRKKNTITSYGFIGELDINKYSAKSYFNLFIEYSYSTGNEDSHIVPFIGSLFDRKILIQYCYCEHSFFKENNNQVFLSYNNYKSIDNEISITQPALHANFNKEFVRFKINNSYRVSLKVFDNYPWIRNIGKQGQEPHFMFNFIENEDVFFYNYSDKTIELVKDISRENDDLHHNSHIYLGDEWKLNGKYKNLDISGIKHWNGFVRCSSNTTIHILNIGISNGNFLREKNGYLLRTSFHHHHLENGNINIENCYVSAVINQSQSAGFIGKLNNSNTFIKRCYFSGVIENDSMVKKFSDEDKYNAGFIGEIEESVISIETSYVNSDLSGMNCSGFIGDCSNSDILFNNCYCDGDINSEYSSGFVSNSNSSDISMVYCYTTGNKTIDDNGINKNVYGMIADSSGDHLYFEECYAVDGKFALGYIDVSYDILKYANGSIWDNYEMSGYVANPSTENTFNVSYYPILAEFQYFPWRDYLVSNYKPIFHEIEIYGDFNQYLNKNLFLDYLNKIVFLTGDISINNIESYIILKDNWIFNGNTKTIYFTDIRWNGLFQIQLMNSNLQNRVSILNLSIQYTPTDETNRTYIKNQSLFGNGYIVQKNQQYCIVKNCSVDAPIVNKGGGIVGSNCNDIEIENCYTNGNIYEEAGGILGSSCNHFTVKSCYSTGNIYNYAGGILGSNCGDSGENIIKTCYSTGDIVGSYAGGIIGSSYNFITIENSYSTGDIYGEKSSGLIGYNTKTTYNARLFTSIAYGKKRQDAEITNDYIYPNDLFIENRSCFKSNLIMKLFSIAKGVDFLDVSLGDIEDMKIEQLPIYGDLIDANGNKILSDKINITLYGPEYKNIIYRPNQNFTAQDDIVFQQVTYKIIYKQGTNNLELLKSYNDIFNKQYIWHVKISNNQEQLIDDLVQFTTFQLLSNEDNESMNLDLPLYPSRLLFKFLDSNTFLFSDIVFDRMNNIDNGLSLVFNVFRMNKIFSDGNYVEFEIKLNYGDYEVNGSNYDYKLKVNNTLIGPLFSQFEKIDLVLPNVYADITKEIVDIHEIHIAQPNNNYRLSLPNYDHYNIVNLNANVLSSDLKNESHFVMKYKIHDIDTLYNLYYKVNDQYVELFNGDIIDTSYVYHKSKYSSYNYNYQIFFYSAIISGETGLPPPHDTFDIETDKYKVRINMVPYTQILDEFTLQEQYYDTIDNKYVWKIKVQNNAYPSSNGIPIWVYSNFSNVNTMNNHDLEYTFIESNRYSENDVTFNSNNIGYTFSINKNLGFGDYIIFTITISMSQIKLDNEYKLYANRSVENNLFNWASQINMGKPKVDRTVFDITDTDIHNINQTTLDFNQTIYDYENSLNYESVTNYDNEFQQKAIYIKIDGIDMNGNPSIIDQKLRFTIQDENNNIVPLLPDHYVFDISVNPYYTNNASIEINREDGYLDISFTDTLVNGIQDISFVLTLDKKFYDDYTTFIYFYADKENNIQNFLDYTNTFSFFYMSRYSNRLLDVEGHYNLNNIYHLKKYKNTDDTPLKNSITLYPITNEVNNNGDKAELYYNVNNGYYHTFDNSKNVITNDFGMHIGKYVLDLSAIDYKNAVSFHNRDTDNMSVSVNTEYDQANKLLITVDLSNNQYIFKYKNENIDLNNENPDPYDTQQFYFMMNRTYTFKTLKELSQPIVFYINNQEFGSIQSINDEIDISLSTTNDISTSTQNHYFTISDDTSFNLFTYHKTIHLTHKYSNTYYYYYDTEIEIDISNGFNNVVGEHLNIPSIHSYWYGYRGMYKRFVYVEDPNDPYVPEGTGEADFTIYGAMDWYDYIGTEINFVYDPTTYIDKGNKDDIFGTTGTFQMFKETNPPDPVTSDNIPDGSLILEGSYDLTGYDNTNFSFGWVWGSTNRLPVSNITMYASSSELSVYNEIRTLKLFKD